MIVFLLLLLLNQSVFSSVYESNALAMALEKKDALSGTGYERADDDLGYTLYLDGTVIEKRISRENGYIIERDGKTEEYILDESGRIVEERREGKISRNNYAESGLLLSSSVSSGDEIISFTSYYYDASGSLIRVDGLSYSLLFSPDGFYFERDGENFLIRDGINIVENTAESNVRENADGTVSVLEADGALRLYSPSGLLLRETYDERYTIFTYDDEGLLLKEESVDGDDITIRCFSSGTLSRIEYYRSATLERRVIYDEGSITEERYRDGSVYAIIEYDRDGRTIKGIRT